MKLSVGTNFDDRLPLLLKDSHVDVFYGKLSSDLVGGGRPTFALPTIDRTRVEEHVKLLHAYGFKFNYLLNATCLDNLETTKEFHYRLRELLEWIGTLQPEYVTVSLPMLVDMVRTALPDVKISLSTFANVNTLRQAHYFEERGVSEITLPESRNRDFAFLESLRKSTSCDYQLIATNDCLLDCPMRQNHANFQSHASQCNHVTDGFALDYYMLRCTERKLQHPEELLKSQWIRPEDMHIYEELGYHKFKLTERMKTTEKIADTALAYSGRSYQGNLLSLLNSRMAEADFEMPNFSKNIKEDFAPSEKMRQVYSLLFSFQANIDNESLEGFLEGFRAKRCDRMDCDKCGYCAEWASRTVQVAKPGGAVLQEFEQLFAALASGTFFESAVGAPVTWTAESQSLYEGVVGRKPEFIRDMASTEIRKKAEELAAANGTGLVSRYEVAKANVLCTPADFRMFALMDLRALGFDTAELDAEEAVG